MSRLVIILVFAALIKASRCQLSPDVSLLNHIFNNYNVNARPSPNVDTSVNLTYDIALRQVLDLDEKRQVMTTSVWIRQYWRDPFLVWDSKKWSNISYVYVLPQLVWRPDIALYNNAEINFQSFDDFGKTRITVYNTSDVVWLIPVILRSECRMNMNNFPFDTQTCPMTFGSWSLDGLALDFCPKNPTGDMSSFAKNGEFNTYGLEANRVSKVYNCCPNPYVTITYVVHLQRRVKFYLYNLIIPGILIAFLSCFSFFLPPMSGERIGLIITNFLSLSVYVLMISDSIPPSSDCVPTLVRFYTAMISEIGVALVLNCIIIPLAEKRRPDPNIVRLIVLHYLAKLFMCTVCTEKKKEKTEDSNENNFININNNNNKYKNTQTEQNQENMATYIPKNHSKEILNYLKDHTTKMTNNSDFEHNVLGHLTDINTYLSAEGKSRDIENDWEEVVRVLDRLFFVAFGISVIASAVCMMLDAPEIVM